MSSGQQFPFNSFHFAYEQCHVETHAARQNEMANAHKHNMTNDCGGRRQATVASSTDEQKTNTVRNMLNARKWIWVTIQNYKQTNARFFPIVKLTQKWCDGKCEIFRIYCSCGSTAYTSCKRLPFLKSARNISFDWVYSSAFPSSINVANGSEWSDDV